MPIIEEIIIIEPMLGIIDGHYNLEIMHEGNSLVSLSLSLFQANFK